jgi:hypothetical protein
MRCDIEGSLLDRYEFMILSKDLMFLMGSLDDVKLSLCIVNIEDSVFSQTS